MIDVDFQDRVGISKVDGVNYLKTIDYSIVCDPGVNPWEMRLTVSGTATAFDGAAVQTNINGLGIRLLQNGLPFTLNTPVVVPRGSKLVLQAVPVQKPGVDLSEGAFAAVATLQAEYQ
jgi:type 1 fimbria pilin